MQLKASTTEPVCGDDQPSKAAAMVAGEMPIHPLLGALGMPICLIDRNATIIAANPAWHDLVAQGTLWPADTGRDYRQLWQQMNAQDNPGVQNLLTGLDSVLSGQTDHHTEHYRPGENKAYQIRVDAVPGENWAVTHTPIDESSGVAQSSSDRPTIRADQMALIAKYTHNAVAITDAERRIEWVNEGFERTTGYCLEEVTGKVPGEIHHGPDTDPETVAQLRASIAYAREVTVEILNYRKNGEPYWAQVEIRPIFDGSGRLTNFISVSADITELKRKTTKLQDREAYFRAITENALEAIIVIDQEGNISLFNRAAEQLFGYTRDEIMGQPINCLLREDFAQTREQDRQQLLQTGQSQLIGHKGIDIVCLTKNKEEKQILMTTCRFELSGGESHFAGIFHDTTEQRKLEADLAHAQKLEAVGQLAAGIAHEINTPVQYISSNVEFLKQAFADLTISVDQLCSLVTDSGDDHSKLVQTIEELREEADLEFLVDEIPGVIKKSLEGVTRISKVVQAMKDFAQTGDAKEPADLNTAIETTIAMAGNEWRECAQVVTDLATDLPQVNCVISEIRQSILIMLVNAAQAIQAKNGDDAKEPGSIEVASAVHEDYAMISIKDSGVGMTEHIKRKIFDPFFTTKTVGSGAGQGLTVVHRLIVEKHHGRIEVESEPGEGSEFKVFLPLT